MNVLISGGFGFIGSYLTPRLLASGARVGVIARRIPSSFTDIARSVDCYVHEFTDRSRLRVADRYDCFVHLAGALHSVPEPSTDAVDRALAVTRENLELCRANGITRFIHFSTFQVYGRDHGFIDEQTPISCRNDYARAHYLAEEEVRGTGEQGGIEYVIVRPTNCYGFSAHVDVQRWSLVPGCFCREAVERQEIVLKTSGLQEKDFIHLDHVAGLTEAICASFAQFRNQTVNLASGCTHTIRDIAMRVKAEYEHVARASCSLRVLSDSPAPADRLVVSRSKIAGLTFTPSGDLTVATDIRKILSYLTS